MTVRFPDGRRTFTIDLNQRRHYVLHEPRGVLGLRLEAMNVLASARRGVVVFVCLGAVALVGPAFAQEPVPVPDPAPAGAAPPPAPGATPDPAPAPKPAVPAGRSSARAQQPQPAPVGATRQRSSPSAETTTPSSPVVRRAHRAATSHRASAPQVVVRRSTTMPAVHRRTQTAPSHRRRRPASHRGPRGARKPAHDLPHRAAPPEFPAFVPARALAASATERAPGRPLALAAGALLALVVASSGVLALTARAERRRTRV
jgi:hypothetical protein